MGEVYCKGCKWANRYDGSIPLQCTYERGRIIDTEIVKYNKNHYHPAHGKNKYNR